MVLSNVSVRSYGDNDSGPVAVVVAVTDDDLRRPLNMPSEMYGALAGTYNMSQLAAILATFKRQAAVATNLTTASTASVYKRGPVSEPCDVALIQVSRSTLDRR